MSNAPLDSTQSSKMPIPPERRFAEIVTLSAGLLWQLYVVITAYRQAPRFEVLFAGLGGPLPLVTRSFLATYRFWGLLPLLFAALTVDILRRRNPSLRYFGLVLAAGFLSALVLHAWLYEAIFAPLNTILDKISVNLAGNSSQTG